MFEIFFKVFDKASSFKVKRRDGVILASYPIYYIEHTRLIDSLCSEVSGYIKIPQAITRSGIDIPIWLGSERAPDDISRKLLACDFQVLCNWFRAYHPLYYISVLMNDLRNWRVKMLSCKEITSFYSCLYHSNIQKSFDKNSFPRYNELIAKAL